MLDNIVKNSKLVQVAEALAPGEQVRLAGVWGSAGAMVAATLGKLKKAPVLFIAAHLDDADQIADDIEVLTSTPAQLFPAWEVDIGTDHVNDEIAGERLRVCNLLDPSGAKSGESVEIIVAPVMALLQPVPSVDQLNLSRLSLIRGSELALDDLAGWLVDAGFEALDQVDQAGQFARRGGIVDIFPMGVTQAVRVEFFGDQIDSIRQIDLDTQRSTGEIDGFDITSIVVGHSLDRATNTNLLSYLPKNTVICMAEPAEVTELAHELYDRMAQIASGEGTGIQLFAPSEIFKAVGEFAQLEIYQFSLSQDDKSISLGIRSLERLAINTREALKELEDLSQAADVWVFCENTAEQKRFRQLLGKSNPQLAGRLKFGIGHVNSSFYWPDQKLAVAAHHEVFRRYAKVRRIRRIRAGRPIDTLLDLQAGDYVVHVAHGIARFDGLRTMDRDGQQEEFLSLRFAGNAILHVPASRIDLIQKYIGAKGKRPSLSKLGGTSWSNQKKKVELAVKDMAAEMLRVQAMRQSIEGVSFPAETQWQEQFADEFIYAETPDQIAAIQQVDEDMKLTRPMDRLLCGDVGYGKTELAMRAAFKVAEAGRQVAVLVPTTVLAAQHFQTFTERFADYPFQIDLLSRFRTASQQSKTIKRLALGQVDILIGTHRILSKDVVFGDLGLVVIDEEQRFGVEHKEHLKAMRATVEVLTMTATPIPRTLHLALLGLRDISSLATPPLDRRAIHTEVCHYDDRLIKQAILREMNRNGQVFFVHNRVYNIESVADHVRSMIPDARVETGHGQMGKGQLESTMLRFVNGEVDVLVCTTIIESGLDIPSANTMIIHDADRFGLAELHQLRGRIGRYKHRAYCYLLLPKKRTVPPTAARRLKAIEEFSDLGAGFQIAMRDLEIRGAGNILGKEQSGHIAAVGYELYCQLLDRSVKQLSGKATVTHHHVHVDLGVEAFITKGYIPSDRQRMEIYRRFARCHSSEDVKQLSADLLDAFGPLDEQVQLLLDLTEVRSLAGVLGIDSIILVEPDIVFGVRDFSLADKFLTGAPGSVRLPDAKTAHWRPPRGYLQMPTMLNVLRKRLSDAAASL